MLIKKNPKKMLLNLIKYQVENCPALPERNLISTCNRRVESISAGRVEVSSRHHVIITLQINMKVCTKLFKLNPISTKGGAIRFIY